MKISVLKITSLFLAASLSVVFAQSKFSGIYSGKVDGQRLLIATTQGGRILGLDNTTRGLRNAVDPTKSTVSSTGRVKGAVPNGATFSGSIDSAFVLKGTFKDGTESFRFSTKRILK